MRLGAVNMSFEYSDYFGSSPQTGYETLIYDCMMGDPTLFQRADMVEAAWSVVQPILDVVESTPASARFPELCRGHLGAGASIRAFAARWTGMARPYWRVPAKPPGRSRQRNELPRIGFRPVAAPFLL